ncbi:uncharacterized protein LOC119942255 [Tachyglossus aculeatus]|uniref:uncharacterized protein LOC119942255 n=1 Tax=Tachyglossus aculeatus TaxID=9261 RepID=UPI0018F75779|nr:uncharacterized protein LOC119942255 [Tachyglossus aculeatus]
MSELWGCAEAGPWRAALGAYGEAVRARATNRPNLEALDRWYQEELPAAIAGRREKHLTRDELVRLMAWKLARGKFRPRLQQLVAANPSETVERSTRAAFGLLPNVEAAIAELSKLRAVGPATASAILAAGAPDSVAFMADEAVAAVPGLLPIRYTLRHYTRYLGEIRAQAERLNRVDAEADWTPHRVEMSLWAWTVARAERPDLLAPLPPGGTPPGGDAGDREAGRTKRRKTSAS